MAAANLAYPGADEQPETVTTRELYRHFVTGHDVLKNAILKSFGVSHPYDERLLREGIFVEEHVYRGKNVELYRMFYDDADRILRNIYPADKVYKAIERCKANRHYETPKYPNSKPEEGMTYESEDDRYLPVSNGRRRYNSVTTLELANEMGISHKQFLEQAHKHTGGRFKKHGMKAEVYPDGTVYRLQYRMTYEAAWPLKDTLGRELKQALGRLKDTESGADPMTPAEEEEQRIEREKARKLQEAMEGTCWFG